MNNDNEDLKQQFYDMALSLSQQVVFEEELADFKSLFSIDIKRAYIFFTKLVKNHDIDLNEAEQKILDDFYWVWIN
jgi:hypothetical protein